jgi:RNA polymerase sigma-70 factor (ECF subfamily)
MDAASHTSSGPPAWNWLRRALQRTRLSLVQRIRFTKNQSGRSDANEFCRCYWYPLYSYLRHRGYGPEEAQDHVQTFLVSLLNDNLLATFDPSKGRLRNFLITLLMRHVARDRVRRTAKKRGGEARHVPLDWAAAECAFEEDGRLAATAEELYRRTLAIQLVQDGIAGLRARYEENGSIPLFEALVPSLEGPLPEETYDDVAARLDMKPGAVRTAAIRMRERFRRAVQSSAAVLLGIPEGPLLDAELKELFCGSTRHAGL